jgi:2-keto-4-pentenoate hydratase
MPADIDKLVDRIADRTAGRSAWVDILEDAPELSEQDAYRVQFGLMRRRVAEGDRIVGYKAAYTSLAIQAQRGNGGAIVGGILASALESETRPIAIVPDARNAVEPEVAVVLAQDLPGPHVSAIDVMRATRMLMPAIEVAVGAPGHAERSRQMVIATHKTAGSIIVGGPGRSPDGLDLRLEGAVMWIDGTVRGSATAVEVLGNPFESAAFIANTVLANGEVLKAGMILMTGSIFAAIPVEAGCDVRVDFTRLGSIGIRFAP